MLRSTDVAAGSRRVNPSSAIEKLENVLKVLAQESRCVGRAFWGFSDNKNLNMYFKAEEGRGWSGAHASHVLL